MILRYSKTLKPLSRQLRNRSTLSEVLLWNRLKRKQMMGYQFLRQKPIGRYIVDFFCPKLALVIEIDGRSHAGKEPYDRQRQYYLESLELKVVRFQDNSVKRNMEAVLKQLCKALEDQERKATSPAPPSKGDVNSSLQKIVL